jgi:predicted MFS family arabinose efflux permease
MKLFRSLIFAYRAAFAGLDREVWLLAGALFVNRAGTMVLPFLSLYLTKDLGFSSARAGLIIGCFGLGSMLGSFLGGWLSDRADPLRIQQLSLITSGIGFALFVRLESFPALAVGIFTIAALGDAFRPALLVAIAHRSTAKTQSRAFALIRLAANLGMAVGPAVAGILAVHGYALIFFADALTCWAAAVILIVSFKNSVGGGVESDHRQRHIGRSPWSDGPYLVFLVLIVLLAMTFFQVWSTLPIYLRSVYGLSERAIGLLLALNAILIVLAEMPLIRAVERRDRMRTVGVGAFFVCIGLALLPLASVWTMAVLSMVVLTVGEMLSMPISNAIVAERAGRAAVGSYMGAYTLAFSTAFVIGPVIGTAVYQHLGAGTLWFGIGAVGAFLGLGFAALSRPLRAPR